MHGPYDDPELFPSLNYDCEERKEEIDRRHFEKLIAEEKEKARLIKKYLG
jgi:hypothetical protein